MNYKEICDNTLSLITETANMVREMRKNLNSEDISAKGKNDFVTEVDKASELKLVSGMKEILPGSGFITEEGTAFADNEVYKWIIDPIDGTTNFMHGAPPYAISVALTENNKTVIGIVYDIASDECFYSYLGGKVFLNGIEVEQSSKSKVSDMLLATGFPYTAFGRIDQFIKTLIYFMEHSHGVRRLGSAAIDLAYVACGRYDGFYEYNLTPWDVAAGAFLIQQAGGKVTDFKGDNNWLYGKEIVASNSYCFDEFLMTVSKIMNE